MRRELLSWGLATAVSFGALAQPARSDAEIEAWLRESLNTLKQENSATVQQLKESEAKIARLQSEVNNVAASDTRRRLEILEEKYREIEERNKLIEAARVRTRQARYAAGKAAIEHMLEKVAIIAFMQELVKLEVSFQRETNVWNNDDLRNTWDNVRDIGTPVGLVAAGLGGIMYPTPDMEQQSSVGAAKALAISGVVAVGVSQLLGAVFGSTGAGQANKTVEGIAEKIAFLEISRRGYDDLLLRKEMLQTFIVSNGDFERRLREFRVRFDQAEDSDAQAAVIADLVPYMDEFEGVLAQIPRLLDLYGGAADQYLGYRNLFARDETLIKQLEALSAKVSAVRARYSELSKSFLRLKPEFRRLLVFSVQS